MLRRAREHGYREGFVQGREQGGEAGYSVGLEQGKEDGHRQGYEQGLASGRHESLAKVNLVHSALTACWQELSEWRDACGRELDEQLVSVVRLICQQVIQLELNIRPDGVRALLDHALGLLPQTDSASIRLNPEDRVYLETLNLALPDQWQVTDDDAITAGGCILSTPGGRVDAQVEARLAVCIAELRKSLGLPDANGNGE
ncbi:flagellar assembly protein FliH [Kistimonas scapharcae]|uniref:Flagellar assembly protein FliH n=2 Tax=Kistimonas scapharcae TaxID=1036133 RepID=A0ABP8V7Q8_9GAMM